MVNDKSESTILVVDDEEKITTILRESLESEGYQTFVARDGEEAIRIFDEVSPNLVILDLVLPKIDGIDVCRYIRQSSSVPILIISARSYKEIKVECLDSGADDYLTKPFDIDELLARIRALFRRSQNRNPDKILQNFVCNNLEINFNTRQVTVADKVVELTSTEYELLRELIINRARVVSYDELLEKVWGPKYGNQKTYLHDHISNLRKKIEPDSKYIHYIVNVYKYCYRFGGKS